MSNEKSATALENVSQIDLSKDYEVRHWTNELGITEERLYQLVKDHGTSVEAVRSALGR